jgi:uncharacterized protein (TIGR03086 family)
MDIPDTRKLDRRALETLDRIAGGITAADLGRPTPCTGWTLADLLVHQISENRAFSIALREGTAPDWQSGSLGTDPYRDYADSVTAYLDAAESDGVLDRDVTVREFGTFPGAIAVTMHLVDSVAHGWDLAKTLGVPYEQDPEAVQAALAFAQFIPADEEKRTGPDASFAPVVSLGPEASELDRFLGLVGRDPGRQPG